MTMKGVMMRKFIIVLLIALSLSSIISGVMLSRMFLQNTKENMCFVLGILDRSLDYTEVLQAQMGRIQDYITAKDARFTIMTKEGRVLADNSINNVSQAESHKDREECREALENGVGYAVRYSETLDISMLYVAILSENEEYLLRAAVPYKDNWIYIRMLFPALFIGFAIAIGISMLFAVQFSKSIIHPLQEIAGEMNKVNDKSPAEFQFPKYAYEELNIIADTTMHMSKEVDAYIKKMEMERRIRQEFFSNASHELKTPITSIQGYAELLENSMVESEEMKSKILSRIRKEAENMTGLINDILMISKLETKETQVATAKVRMAPLIEELVTDLTPAAKEESVTLTWESEPLVITANPQQMKELVSNLVTNAIKYNKPGGSVHISVKKLQEEMELTVQDTGVGIMKIDIERIFERFYRANKGRSKKVNGTGLGLSIVKHIVNFYEGSIRVDSEPDKGTTFVVHIPLERSKV